ncbi:MAG: glycoside hydrolase family 97 N-terminal domain-containing protein, partial [Blastocatellia bacterium]
MSRLFMTLVRWCVSLAITGLTGGLSLALAQGVPAKSARRCEQDQTVALLSPDGKLRVEFSPRSAGARNGAPFYSVWRRGKRLIEPSGLGLDLAETGPLRANLCLRTVSRNSHDETYRVSVGKSSAARDHYREAVISLEEGLEEQPEPRRRIELVFRAYNDGIAFRYRIPRQPALARFTIAEEHSQFSLPPDSRAYALPLDSFTTSYEKYYRVIPLKEIAAESLIGLPLLAQHPGGTWIAVTEAGLTDYAGMYLSKSSQLPGVLVSRLSPWPGQPEVKVKASAPHASPWRVLLIGDRPATLIESNLVLNLNEACAIADTSWIKPGKTAFPWWNDYVVKDADFAGGLNTRTMKYYIDFCAEYGIEYHSLDGFQNRAWYGGPISPVGKTDITTAVPEIDLPEV